MRLIDLRCKNCGAALKTENVVERLAMARCDHCDAVFGIEGLPNSDQSRTTRERGEVPLPSGITVENFGNELTIHRRWFHPVFFFLVFFCIIWNGFMVVWHAISISTGMWIMSVFGLLHTAVGLGLAYFVVAGFVNTTTIRAGRGLLQVRHGPVPWPGNKSLTSHDIKQLYSKQQVHRGKNGTSYSYVVHAITTDNRREKLLSGLKEAEQALYIEQQIERFLGIRDEAVGAELPR